MFRGSISKILVVLLLGFLTVSAFLIRLENFKKTDGRSIDEIVYSRLGVQLKNSFPDYNIMAYGRELAAMGRQLPEYFFAPLFKHPPAFPFFISLSMRLYGDSFTAAGYVSMLFGVLLIPLVYFLGKVAFTEKSAWLAAVLMWIDPVGIICSQKVWMDTTITFFTGLTILFFLCALRYKKDFYFLLSGISTAILLNTKYTGVLIFLALGVFSFIYQRHLFSKKVFIISLLTPLALLLPWIIRNCQIYGFDVLGQLKMHTGNQEAYELTLLKVRMVLLIIFLLALRFWIRRRSPEPVKAAVLIKRPSPVQLQKLSYIFASFFIVFLLGKSIFLFLQWEYIPLGSWVGGIFHHESVFFYFNRLIEYSLLYVFSFWVILTYHPQESEAQALLRFSAVTILLFFMAWGSYQSRYILPAVPFLIVLAADYVSKLYERIQTLNRTPLRLVLKLIFMSVMIYSVWKTSYINLFFSFPNDMCYF